MSLFSRSLEIDNNSTLIREISSNRNIFIFPIDISNAVTRVAVSICGGPLPFISSTRSLSSCWKELRDAGKGPARWPVDDGRWPAARAGRRGRPLVHNDARLEETLRSLRRNGRPSNARVLLLCSQLLKMFLNRLEKSK